VQGPASSTGAVSVPPSAEAVLRPAVNVVPVPEEAEVALRRQSRKKAITVAVAVAAICALGGVAWHLLSSPSTKNEAPSPRALAATEAEKKAEPPAPAPAPTAAPEGPGDPPIAQIPEPPPAVKAAAPTPAPVAPTSPEPAAPAKPAPSLLSGLNTLQTPGPAAGAKGPGSGAAAGSGLEATAIQRTVRKYSPAVRQNCWQRALNARAPGVPSSAKVTATITVDISGKVQSVTASGAPRGYPGLAHCIEEAVRGWTFPRSLGETVTNVPFVFVGQ
jgi:hypothetical protein